MGQIIWRIYLLFTCVFFPDWTKLHVSQDSPLDVAHRELTVELSIEQMGVWINQYMAGFQGTLKWAPQGSAVFTSLFPGLVEQGGVQIEPLPKEVPVYLMTTSKAPYCGE